MPATHWRQPRTVFRQSKIHHRESRHPGATAYGESLRPERTAAGWARAVRACVAASRKVAADTVSCAENPLHWPSWIPAAAGAKPTGRPRYPSGSEAAAMRESGARKDNLSKTDRGSYRPAGRFLTWSRPAPMIPVTPVIQLTQNLYPAPFLCPSQPAWHFRQRHASHPRGCAMLVGTRI
jgi:hypothetical protein